LPGQLFLGQVKRAALLAQPFAEGPLRLFAGVRPVAPPLCLEIQPMWSTL
jgi:hypothetical protein